MNWLSDTLRYGLTATHRAAGRRAEQYAQAVVDYQRELADLPLDEAKRAADGLLARPSLLRLEPWASRPSLPAGLTANQVDVLSRFRRIGLLRGEAYLDAGAITPYPADRSLLLVGAMGEHVHLVVRVGSEPLFGFADDVPDEAGIETTFASVYHFLLWLHRSEELLGT